MFHHVPCRECFYCRRKLYAQCATYKKVGVTAGFEPAGGGFSQYVRVMDWIVRQGVEKIADGVPFDRACFVEPVNTCLKAVVQVEPQPGELALVLGQGPIGLLFTMLVRRTGARVVATDTIARRRELALRFGAEEAWDPGTTAIEPRVARAERGAGRGPGDRGRIRARAGRAGRPAARGRGAESCCSPKPPIKKR